MTGLQELIAKLEAAPEGSRELDFLIEAAIGTYGDGGYERMNALPEKNVIDALTEFGWCAQHKRYTTSLDAAVSLVPDGWRVGSMKDGIHCDGGIYCEVSLWCPRNSALGYRFRANGATPAIAISISALRAMEADHAE